ncbi:tripartite motif-containing protein 16-like protein isoform X1 [Onychostoma macrolepis]|uniref:tripartite motif-containing protein 16-like protein isoform X1 n=2 Tax=Onychostoma macrolepis TaxID=369639 RepID=UPI00272A67DE|nr:tripartite motif-containing protein 16-like protein isoform X1 [Onychostoma macrolepis]
MNQVEKMQRTTTQKIQERQKTIEELKQVVNTLKHSAQTAVEHNEKIFTELILSIKKRQHEVTQLIRDQERTEVSRAEGLLEQLEQEISDLQRRDTELDQHSHTEQHFPFKNLSVSSESEESYSMTVDHILFDGLRKSLSDLKQHFEDLYQEEISNIFSVVARIQILPLTRNHFKHYFCSFTLDPNTVIEHLVLSENNRQMTHTGHLGIYKFPCKVFCKESVFGRCYWEVEWNGRCVHISVSYKEISGTGKGLVGMFGNNNTSWSLQCFPKPVFWHKSIKTEISRPLSSRVGVFVDYKAGTLSFYSVSDTVTLLHSVQTTFTQPLYPGFWFSASGSGDLLNLDDSGSNTNVFSSVKLCDPLI